MKSFFAGTADFTISTSVIGIFPGQEQEEVVFTLEPDTVAQEPNEEFQIQVTVIDETRPLLSNEFLQLTKRVIIIDRTSKPE